MADSLVEIVNTTLTATELPNSSTEHTLLTTDANTSYVIKDVQINTGISDLNLDATINNFNLGSWAETLTGSEIMDVSSNIKVTSSSFPIDLNHVGYGLFNDTPTNVTKGGQLGVANNVVAKDNMETFSITSYYATSGANYRNGFISSGNNVYQIYMDNNSTQEVLGWLNGATAANFQPSLKTNYVPVVLAAEQDAIYFCGTALQLKKLTLSTGVESTIASNVFLSTSSYTRSDYCNGWLWYMRSSSYTTDVIAVRVSDGKYINFQSLSIVTYGAGMKLAVSYDQTSDKFYVYRTNNSTDGTIIQSICPITKTAMDAITANTTNNTAWTNANSAGAQTTFLLSGDYFGATMAGHPTVGDKFYASQRTNSISTHDLVVCTFSTGSYIKVLNGEANTGPIINSFTPTAAQIDDFGYAGPPSAIDVRITGVKSTTS